MARLFGLLAKNPVDFSISQEKQSVVSVSTHGWGISWYEPTGKISVHKEIQSVLNPAQNKPIAVKITSNILLFHTRQATSGSISVKNCHPFTYKHDAFAHTGHVHKEELESCLVSPFSSHYQSEPIDSEIYFRLLEQNISQFGDREGIMKTIVKANSPEGSTFILTTSVGIYGYKFGKPLYFAYWNKPVIFQQKSSETNIVFESKSLSNTPAVFVSSERFGTVNWQVLDDGELFASSKDLRYSITKLL